ncbi:hypothetical protein JOD64_002781 [Micromonospora luteifusca]|uniref:Uncharacterized protein n=1 Tax=Micromonospora luteifusca TaxID=709860 RepID=A0ABS2LUH5_9ACTN|nr:hypothetical protein [Micromonospora luteifusca]MBM7491559.1 hypothetical protein [Micromonospora luteifusca]
MSRKTGKPSYVRQAQAEQTRRMPLTVVIVLVVMAVLAGGLGGFLIGRPDSTTRAVEELRAQEAVRDKQQIQELTVVVGDSQKALDTLLAAFDGALEKGQPADAATVQGWQTTIRQLVAKHAESPSGTTATNVARGGFRGAVNDFAVTVDLFAAAQAGPEAQRAGLIEIVKRSRTAAAAAWSVAADQLDQINVDAGLGHQHAYLTGQSGGEGHTD